MKRRGKHMLLCCLLAGLLVLCGGCGAGGQASASQQEAALSLASEPAGAALEEPTETGYRAAATTEDGFLAAGTGGRLDQISLDGQATPLDTGTTAVLNGVLSDGKLLLACGADGTILRSDGGAFVPCDTGTDGTFFDLAKYGGVYYAAASGGKLYRSADGVTWTEEQLETDRDIIALAASDCCLAAVTAETDLFLTADGDAWEAMNFNEKYDGLYPKYTFVNAVPAGETFFLLGYCTDKPNVPLILYTQAGEVFSQKTLGKINGEEPTGETRLRINDLGFLSDQMLGACDDGELLSITECSVCHTMRKLEGAGNLKAVAVRQDGVLFCGDGFFSEVTDGQDLRQDKISVEQAKADLETGAVLIDVREQDELDESGYIPGSIHIPVGQVEELLPQLVPDQSAELIFYCAAGVRAQTALETAISMGYERVYNLGGLSDWPYEIVKDGEPSAVSDTLGEQAA